MLYDPEISVIRGIEGYQSTIPAGELPVKVYFLMYGTLHTAVHSRVFTRGCL